MPGARVLQPGPSLPALQPDRSFSHMTDTLLNAPYDGIAAGNEPRLSVADRPFRLWATVRKWSGKGLLALLDQGLISGANFLIAILLARHLATRQYGAYALTFEVFLFLAVVYGALVLEPLSVFGSSIYRDQLRDYLAALLRIHVVMAVIILAGVSLAALVLHEVEPREGLSAALLGVAVAAPCLLLFWLARRVSYVGLNPQQAVLGATVYFAVLSGGLVLIHRSRHLSPLLAFMLMAAGAAVTTPLMLNRLRRRMASASGSLSVLEVIRRHWRYGRSALASALAIWFSTAILYMLLAGSGGLGDVGEMKALMNFSSPIGQVFAALTLLSLPFAARVQHQRGVQGMHPLLWKLTGLYGGGTLLYWVIVVTFRGPIVNHLYSGKYVHVTTLLPWVALGSILRITATAQTITLRAMHSPALALVAYSAAGVVAVVAGIPSTRFYGVRGAVFTLILSSAAALIVARIMVRRRISPPNMGGATTNHVSSTTAL